MFTRWSLPISHVYFGGLALFLYTLFREQSNNHFLAATDCPSGLGLRGSMRLKLLFQSLWSTTLDHGCELTGCEAIRNFWRSKGILFPRWERLPAYAARLCTAVFLADFLTMFLMNVARLRPHGCRSSFLSFSESPRSSFSAVSLRLQSSQHIFRLTQRRRLTLLALLIIVLLAAARLPYLLEGHLHHLVGPGRLR